MQSDYFWVTSEVLPSIRKNGGYIAGQLKIKKNGLKDELAIVEKQIIAADNSDKEERISGEIWIFSGRNGYR